MTTKAIAMPELLLPADNIDIEKWAVVACDQFITKPEYWNSAKEIASDSASTLNLILPEIYLSESEERTLSANKAMEEYLNTGIFNKMPKGFVLVEREIDGIIRRGLMVLVDLDAYDTKAESKPKVRATEKTIMERIPPRVKIRENALVELPHILMLMDDAENKIFGRILGERNSLEIVYDSKLMLGGGSIKGYFIPEGELAEKTLSDLNSLPLRDGMQFCVGDGNHSLATAKEIWKNIKPVLTEEERETHPARYALVELINIYDEGLLFEPIHRILFGVNAESFMTNLEAKLTEMKTGPVFADAAVKGDYIRCNAKDYSRNIVFKTPIHPLAAAMLDKAIEELKSEYSAIEYIHGDSEYNSLVSKEDTLGFYMPRLSKHRFFDLVCECGVMPKKTFSLGEAEGKRYYLEARLIK